KRSIAMKKLIIILALIAVSFNVNAQELELVWAKQIGGDRLKFMPDENFFMTQGSGQMFIHETATGDLVRQFPTDPSIYDFVFIPNSNHIAVSAGTQIKIYNYMTGEVIRELIFPIDKLNEIEKR